MKSNLSHTWPDEDVETLKRMCLDGYSGAQIAEAIGHGVSRNAVIGKAGRLGLKWGKSRRGSPGQAKSNTIVHRAEARASLSVAVPVKAAPAKLDPFRPGKLPAHVPEKVEGVPFLQAAANPHVCSWPLWNDELVGNCCGAPSVPGRPYCAKHEHRSRFG